MEELFKFVFYGVGIFALIGAILYSLKNRKEDGFDEEKMQEISDEAEERLKGKSPDDIIDDELTNGPTVRRSIDRGRDQFHDRVGNRFREILQRFGSKNSNSRNNDDDT